jgi:peptide/nickel transport system permease protein
MKNMLSFEFGDSFVSGRPVWSELTQRIPPTLLLFGTALILSAILGILIGAIMAWRRGSKLEIGGIVVGLFFYSMPIFWFGLILLAVFAFHLEWFPLRGMLTPGANYAGFDYVKDVLWHLTLPLITLTMGSLAGWLLLMRNSMLEVMGEDYITTAKAKGLSERKVMYRHAARNAMLPIVTAMALGLSHVIGGGVLTETIFSWPGMGQYLVQSTYAYDFPAVQGAFFLLAILTIIANMLADLMYSYLDPRVRLTG